jgi:hypothetical protein
VVLAVAALMGLIVPGPVDPGPTLVPPTHPELVASNETPLNITSFEASPSAVLIDAPFYLNTTAEGGAPPYSYWYYNLPPGCRDANTSSLVCYPQNAQHYRVEVTVNDTLGAQASATTNLTVRNGFGLPPLINSFTAWPLPAKVGSIIYLSANATSRSGTPDSVLAYAFLGLPHGCDTFNQSNLSCIPAEPGEFQIWVRVTDGYSQFSQDYLFINVTGTAPSNGSTTTDTSGLSPTDVAYLIVGVVVLIAAIGALVIMRRRRMPPSEPQDASKFPMTGPTPTHEAAPPSEPTQDYRPPPLE